MLRLKSVVMQPLKSLWYVGRFTTYEDPEHPEGVENIQVFQSFFEAKTKSECMQFILADNLKNDFITRKGNSLTYVIHR